MLGDRLLFAWEEFFCSGSLLSYSVFFLGDNTAGALGNLTSNYKGLKSGTISPVHITPSWRATGSVLVLVFAVVCSQLQIAWTQGSESVVIFALFQL